jgi:hypothetical protein
MVYFQTQNPNLDKFWKTLENVENVGIFMPIWNMLWPFGIYYGHLVYYVVIWYIFHRFGTLCQGKSGNPVLRI